MNGLLKVFTEEQYVSEIVDNFSNTEIDEFIEAGSKLLIDAERCLEEKTYYEVGKTTAEVKLDIARIKYNLDKFTEAFLTKEKAEVLMSSGGIMFFQGN